MRYITRFELARNIISINNVLELLSIDYDLLILISLIYTTSKQNILGMHFFTRFLVRKVKIREMARQAKWRLTRI